MWLRKVVILVLTGSKLLSASTSWQDSRNVGNERFADLPPTVFAPGGRLMSVERLPLLISSHSSNAAIAIHCREGVAVVASLPASPYLTSINATNTTTKLLIPHNEISTTAPFCRLSPTVFGITAGNSAFSQLVRETLLEVASAARSSYDGLSPAVAARRLADYLQVRTQQAGKGILPAVTAILVDSQSVWRVDPTGQFFLCRADVAGRLAAQVEHELIQSLKEKVGRKNIDLRNDEIRQILQDMSAEEALEVAAKAIRRSVEPRWRADSVRLCGLMLRSGAIQEYREMELAKLTSDPLSL